MKGFKTPGDQDDWGYRYVWRLLWNYFWPNFIAVQMSFCCAEGRCSPDWSFFALSIDKELHILTRPGLDGPDGTRDASVEDMTKGGEASPAPGTPKFTPQNEGGSNNILAYVSVLAAVVLGLLIYVAFKWWVISMDGSHLFHGCIRLVWGENDLNVGSLIATVFPLCPQLEIM